LSKGRADHDLPVMIGAICDGYLMITVITTTDW
jgi:hypothetical protein